MQIKSRNKLSYIFCTILLLSNCYLARLKVSFTNSGIVSFYLSEIIGIFVLAFIIYYFIRNWKSISKENKILAFVAGIFYIYCFVDYIIRTVIQGLELKSILIFEANLLLIGFMFLITLKIVPTDVVIKSLTVFSCILGLGSVFLFYYTGHNICNEILLNHATRTYILGILFPLSVYRYISLKDFSSAICLYIHFATLIFCGMISAARLNYTVLPFILIISLGILKLNKLLSIRYVLLSFFIPVILIFISANYSLIIYSQMTRLPITNSVIELLNIEYYKEPGTNTSHGNVSDVSDCSNNVICSFDINTLKLSELIQKAKSPDISEEIRQKIIERITLLAAKESTDQSSSMRFYAWEQSIKDIKTNSLFGVGLRQYSSASGDGQLVADIQPHNFILEYTLSFGIIGLLLWIVMIISPLVLASKKVGFKVFCNSSNWCIILAMVAACAGALFQPYFLYACVMTIIYLLIGFYTLSICENK